MSQSSLDFSISEYEILMPKIQRRKTTQRTVTLQEMERLGMIFWTANSPDLNPIEIVWHWAKDYMQEKYPEVHRSYRRLREAVLEAWNAITNDRVKELIATMPARCEAVINEQEGYMKY